MNKNAPGDGNKFLTLLMLLSNTRNGITRRKFKSPMAFFTVYFKPGASFLNQASAYKLGIIHMTAIVHDGKGLGQPACQKEWKKCEEENE
jgi:hypothetical protein